MKKYLLMILAFLFVFVCVVPAAHAVQVKLMWDPNTEPDLAGYRAFYRPLGVETYDYANPVWDGQTVGCTVTVPGNGHFVLRAYNEEGVESGNSNEVLTHIPPNAPAGFTVTLYIEVKVQTP